MHLLNGDSVSLSSTPWCKLVTREISDVGEPSRPGLCRWSALYPVHIRGFGGFVWWRFLGRIVTMITNAAELLKGITKRIVGIS